jgi:L,D-peptidoglycan transpeptidase YkuD (ErfK/YbiS/YcfS/YnhG family)
MTLRDTLTTLRCLAIAAAVALGVVAAPVISPVPAAAQAPFGQAVTVGNARQIVTVRSSGTHATLTGWQLRNGRWARVFGPTQARVGANGTTTSPREGKAATPRGTYTVTEAFGVSPRPKGTRLPYRRVYSQHWWVSDPRSSRYNTWQTGPPNGRWDPRHGERLKAYPTAYAYAIVIDFNRKPVVRGKGSAIFLHVGTGGATAGCVSVSRKRMTGLLGWLDPALRPRIAIG